jgi:opacity protein-like surface antigen
MDFYLASSHVKNLLRRVLVLKKLLAVVIWAVCVVCVAGSVGYAETNPFMDVPLNHWSYDAISALAARGILSGYPDGTYKGRQPMMRYEMASAVARALTVIDAAKADKQDVEMLKRLDVEFTDELNALGVKVNQLDNRLAVVEGRLGGWKLSGELRLDVENWDSDDADGSANMSMTQLELHRWFGEDESIFFYASLNIDGGSIVYESFFADIPFYGDSTLTVGRFARDFEGDYRFQIGGATDMANEAWLTDRTVDGIGFAKEFALGSFNFYAARPGDLPGVDPEIEDSFSVWEFAAHAQLQFTEQFGFDVGVQVFWGDDASTVFGEAYGYKMDNLWTLFGGLRFNFSQNIAFKGIYYYQDGSLKEGSSSEWQDVDTESSGSWKLIVDIRNLFGVTNLWLEYDQLDAEFYMPYGNVALTLPDEGWGNVRAGTGIVGYDTKIWRVGAKQQWNDKWSTWIYAAGHTLDGGGQGATSVVRDAKLFQWGIGAEYQYNESVAFALGYLNADWNDDAERARYVDDHRIQFRTRVAF